ncbi:hypothetical protein FSARC_10930 [Fusarium sarcochroum]|uniref:Hemerythrin-like domain-containing protein n=1 Tax=Fusarium sarcochroum TaxID=1208366 RepID=A0A8H4TJ41_9HYPO|nr:hypothetical protein FSARC_10930 [Fusarium sarcochroum]
MSKSSQPTSLEGPYKLISSVKHGATKQNHGTPVSRMAAEMSLVHNCLIRGINAIYLQSPNIAARGTKKDKLDFANFALRWGDMIHEHHEVEETELFPEVNEICGVPGLMDANVNEHKLFHSGLESYREYLLKVTKENEEFDGVKLQGIVDSFMPVLTEHLENEIDTLLGLEKYSDKTDWEKWLKAKTDGIVKKSMGDPTFRTDVFPLTMVLHDKSFEGGVWHDFPPIPWIVHLVLRWLFMNTRKDWWRFAPSDFSSMPKELPFLK